MITNQYLLLAVASEMCSTDTPASAQTDKSATLVDVIFIARHFIL